jgi:hypothetical protein
MFTSHTSIYLPVAPQRVWMHASSGDFLDFVPLISAVKHIGNNRFIVYIQGLHDDGYCVVESTLRIPPHRIKWHSIGGALNLQTNIVIERESTGSRLSVQLSAEPKNANRQSSDGLKQSFKRAGKTSDFTMERFTTRFSASLS